jgi:signal transduction histidine kinase
MKRVLPIRFWLIVGIVGMVIAAYVGVFAMAALAEVLTPTTKYFSEAAPDPFTRDQLYADVESQPDQWQNPAWQADLRKRLTALGVGVELARGDAQVFVHPSPGATHPETGGEIVPVRDFREVVIYQGRERVGTALWSDTRVVDFSASDNRRGAAVQGAMPFVVALIVGATIWGAVTLASRIFMGPLRQLAVAAAKINAGDLDFTVPASRVAELNEFARAFDSMRDGLKQSVTRQAELEQERRLFVAAMAHDLRTPLTSVRGYLEGIRDGMARTPEKLERYVSVALEKTGALERLVDGLFSYAKTEYLHQAPNREPLDLGALLVDAVAGMRPQAETREVTLQLEPGGDQTVVQGDQAMLQRVVDNLLDNALRHTPVGGTVTVGWQPAPGQVQFWVQDTGPGIPEAELERIFEPTYRADTARGTRTGGAGLGLTIARRLAAAHGGTITASNRDGACFTVTLPE